MLLAEEGSVFILHLSAVYFKYLLLWKTWFDVVGNYSTSIIFLSLLVRVRWVHICQCARLERSFAQAFKKGREDAESKSSWIIKQELLSAGFMKKQERTCLVACTYVLWSQMLSAFWWRVDIELLFSEPLAVRKCQAENALCLQGKKSPRCPGGAVSLQAYSQHGKEMNPDSWVFLACQQQWKHHRWASKNDVKWGKAVVICIFPFSLLSASFLTPLASKRWVGISKERGRNYVSKSQVSP